MDIYKIMYFAVFNLVTDALTALDEGDCDAAKSVLQYAQCKAEEIYIEISDKTELQQAPITH